MDWSGFDLVFDVLWYWIEVAGVLYCTWFARCVDSLTGQQGGSRVLEIVPGVRGIQGENGKGGKEDKRRKIQEWKGLYGDCYWHRHTLLHFTHATMMDLEDFEYICKAVLSCQKCLLIDVGIVIECLT